MKLSECIDKADLKLKKQITSRKNCVVMLSVLTEKPISWRLKKLWKIFMV